MSKKIILFILSFWIASCSAHDEHYYSLHPEALQTALKKCELKENDEKNCEQLNVIAVRINSLALQLRSDPQDFGKHILALQQSIAQQEASLKGANNPELEATLKQDKQQLKERLAVVRWLESPES